MPLAGTRAAADNAGDGFLHSASAKPNANLVKAFRKGLFDMGFIEGQNVTIDFWAGGQNDRLPALASDLVGRNVRLIATPDSTPAAKAATATIRVPTATYLEQ